jgi:hypothetical protein
MLGKCTSVFLQISRGEYSEFQRLPKILHPHIYTSSRLKQLRAVAREAEQVHNMLISKLRRKSYSNSYPVNDEAKMRGMIFFVLPYLEVLASTVHLFYFKSSNLRFLITLL